MARWSHTPARKLLPRSLAFLGELSLIVGVSGAGREAQAWAIPYEEGRLLLADSTGRWMFVLSPKTAEGRSSSRRQAVHAAGLYERFTRRNADAFYNCEVPAFRKPRYCGQILEIRYFSDKVLDDAELAFDDADADELDTGIVEYVHYFENPGVAPAYADLYAVGTNQWVIPPGPWSVTERGIEFAVPPSKETEIWP